MKGYCSFPDKQALSGLIDKIRVSVYEQGTQGPGIPRCAVVLFQYGHMITGFAQTSKCPVLFYIDWEAIMS